MKNPGEIRQKVKQVRYRYLKKTLDNKLRKHPENCKFNGKTGELPDCQHMCCLHRVEEDGWNGIVCDVRLDGKERAERCPVFEVLSTKEAIKEAFDTFLKTADLSEIAFYFPDLAALLWVLDGDIALRDADEDSDFQVSEPDPEPALDPEPESAASTDLPEMDELVEAPSGFRGWWHSIFGGGS